MSIIKEEVEKERDEDGASVRTFEIDRATLFDKDFDEDKYFASQTAMADARLDDNVSVDDSVSVNDVEVESPTTKVTYGPHRYFNATAEQFSQKEQQRRVQNSSSSSSATPWRPENRASAISF